MTLLLTYLGLWLEWRYDKDVAHIDITNTLVACLLQAICGDLGPARFTLSGGDLLIYGDVSLRVLTHGVCLSDFRFRDRAMHKPIRVRVMFLMTNENADVRDD